MIAAVLLILQAYAAPPTLPAAPLPVMAATAIPPLATWPSLPPYPLPRQAVVADASAYIRAEVEAGRCRLSAPPAADGARLVAPVAILVGAGGTVRRIVPQAIGCPTVEQFTVGYLLSLTRGSGEATLRPPPGWYRATMAYRW